MRHKRSLDDPRRTEMLAIRVPWITLQEATFQAWHQLKTRTRYVIEAIEAHNLKHRELPSKRKPGETFTP